MPTARADEVRDRADFVRIVTDVTTLTPRGQNWLGPCPIHGGSEPTLAVHAELKRYLCFECGAKGDVFDFVQATRHVDYEEAVEWVAAHPPIG